MDPLVTVVIPTWNRRALVVEAAVSVAAQTYGRWELVVVDDGSTDGSAEALRALGEPRLKVLEPGRSGNVARLRNAGVRAGSGALVAFLDSDDRWLADKLERQVAALRRGAARWCYSGFRHIDQHGAPIAARAGAFRAVSGDILPALLGDETAAYVGTLLVERALFEAVGGFDESLAMRADLDLALRLAAAAEAAVVPEPLMEVRDHGERTTSGAGYPHELTLAVYERLLARETRPDLRRLAGRKAARLTADAAAYRLARGQVRSGARLLVRAFRLGAGPLYALRALGRALRR